MSGLNGGRQGDNVPGRMSRDRDGLPHTPTLSQCVKREEPCKGLFGPERSSGKVDKSNGKDLRSTGRLGYVGEDDDRDRSDIEQVNVRTGQVHG